MRGRHKLDELEKKKMIGVKKKYLLEAEKRGIDFNSYLELLIKAYTQTTAL